MFKENLAYKNGQFFDGEVGQVLVLIASIRLNLVQKNYATNITLPV